MAKKKTPKPGAAKKKAKATRKPAAKKIPKGVHKGAPRTNKTRKLQRTGKEVAARQKAVQAMYMSGNSVHWIVEQLAINTRTAEADIEVLKDGWRKERKLQWEEHVSNTLGKIAHIEQQANLGWERSLRPATVTEKNFYTIEIDGSADKEVYDLKKRTTEQAGNPNFLMVLLRCISERSKLLGLYKSDDEEGNVDDAPILTVIVETRDQAEGLHRVIGAEQFLAKNVVDGKVKKTNKKGD